MKQLKQLWCKKAFCNLKKAELSWGLEVGVLSAYSAVQWCHIWFGQSCGEGICGWFLMAPGQVGCHFKLKCKAQNNRKKKHGKYVYSNIHNNRSLEVMCFREFKSFILWFTTTANFVLSTGFTNLIRKNHLQLREDFHFISLVCVIFNVLLSGR